MPAFDEACAAEAADAGLTGNFQAIVSTASTTAFGRFPGNPGAFSRMDPVLWAGYASDSRGPLAVTASRKMLIRPTRPWPARPNLLPADVQVWTGAGGPYSISSTNCVSWLSASGTTSGCVTNADELNWSFSPCPALPCDQRAHLFCGETF